MKKKNQKIFQAKCKKQDNQYILNIPDYDLEKLPNISVLTITKNRKKLFMLPVHIWNEYIYPYNKLEWIILDDGNEDLEDILPMDGRIKYIKSGPFKTLGEKRNFGIEQCSHEYISIMDDDDFYFPDSLIAKIKCLLYYPKKQCVFSMPIGVYNTKNGSSQIIKTENKCFPEATMMFAKNFWDFNKYGDTNEEEGKLMIGSRYKRLVEIPFWFNCICLTHGNNITGKLRDIEGSDEASNLLDMIDKETQEIIKNIYD